MKIKKNMGLFLTGFVTLGIALTGLFTTTENIYAINENVEINKSNFPNSQFRDYVTRFDNNQDGLLDINEIESITELDLSNMSIQDFSGIGNFFALQKLDVSGNNLKQIDISRNSEIILLNVADNNLNTLDTSKNPKLETLICCDNEITSLDTRNNRELKRIVAYRNNLSTIDTSNNEKIEILYIGENNINSLDLKNNKELRILLCCKNNISDLDVGNHSKLEALDCSYNNMSILRLEENENLIHLNVSNNQIESVNLEDMDKFGFFDFSNNNLVELDISNMIVPSSIRSSFKTSFTFNRYYGKKVSRQISEKVPLPNNAGWTWNHYTISYYVPSNSNEENTIDYKIRTYFEYPPVLVEETEYEPEIPYNKYGGYNDVGYYKAKVITTYSVDNSLVMDISNNKLLRIKKWDNLSSEYFICNNNIREAISRDGKIYLSEVDPDYGNNTNSMPLYESGVETIDVPEGAMQVTSGNVIFNIVDHIISVLQITFDNTELKLSKGETKTIKPTVFPEDATNKNLLWTSNNNNVAKVDKNGKVTAVNAGEAVITAATEDGGHIAECNVTVTIPVTSVSLNKTSVDLNEGKSAGLKATVRPATATNKNISWSSDDEAVATVDKNGKVTAVGLGTAKITVTTEDGEKTEYCTVNVKPIEVGGVKISKAELTLTEGDHEKLNVTVSPDNATNKAVTWKSSNTDIARVDDDGTVTAVSPGKAAITVTTADRGLRSTCKVTVTVRPVEAEGVYLEDTDVRIMEGETAQLVANIYPSDATNRKMTWKSSNKKVASVDANGKVTALKKGTAEITVTTDDGGYTDTARITVSEKVIDVTGISLSTTKNTMYTGDTFSLSANVTPQDATNKKVTWQSSNEYIAAVDRNGKVTAKNPGTVNITATTDDGGRTATAKIKVIKKTIEVAGLVLDKKLVVLDKGGREKLSAAITPDNADNKTVSWTSSAPDIATVDAYGNITALNNGTAVITAKTSNGKTAACEIRVNFADVASESLYFYKPVYWAAENGITTGANGLFAPHNKCTREHAITFLWRMAGSPAPKSMTSKFKDITNKSSYSYKAIMWGTENGIITGANGVFAPNNTCTREQIVTMLWRLAGKPEPQNNVSKFKDVQNKNSYSYKAILWAAENGITTGANGSFAPGKVCTRAEIVTFIYRYKNLK